MLGPEGLVDLFETSGRSFVVTTVTVNFKQGAKYGDELEVRTRPAATSSYRLEFDQQVCLVVGFLLDTRHRRAWP